MVTGPKENGLSPMPVLDHLNVRLAKPALGMTAVILTGEDRIIQCSHGS